MSYFKGPVEKEKVYRACLNIINNKNILKEEVDQIGLISYLYNEALGVQFLKDMQGIRSHSVNIEKNELETGDIAIFTKSNSDFIIGVILGIIERQLVYFSPKAKKVIIDYFDETVENYRLKECIRLNVWSE